ncbi:hypothetical protein BDZ89DRAFT_435140 [Hymenopellis radicata]|nr:hypothetical protein BDZ89DRAFT_435140 [Hymenopellis radicata]
MVSRGLVSGPDSFAVVDMSLPILPNTRHPRNRQPLVCSQPLPWNDCYIQTLALTSIRIKFSDPVPRDSGKCVLTPEHQASDINFQSEDDNDWRNKLRHMAEIGGTDFEPVSYEEEAHEPEEEPYFSDDSNEDDASSIEPRVVDSVPVATSSNSANIQLPQSGVIVDKGRASLHSTYAKSTVGLDEVIHRYDFTPVVDFCMDLETLALEDFANPWQFFDDIEVIKGIHSAYKARLQVKIDAAERSNAEFDSKLAAARQSSSVESPAVLESAPPASMPDIGANSGCSKPDKRLADSSPPIIIDGSTSSSTLRDSALEDVKDTRRQSPLVSVSKRIVKVVKTLVFAPMKLTKCTV